MQKIINILSVTSFVMSAGIVAGGATVYLNRDSIIESVKEQAMEEVMGAIPDLLGGGLGGGLLGGGGDTPAAAPAGPLPIAVPSLPF